jgi:signal peptidase I
MKSVPREDNRTVLPPASSPEAAAPAGGPPARPKRMTPPISGWLRDMLISLAVSAFFIIFLYQPVKVEGTSMMPTLDDQERVFINKFVYKLEPIERGDVVVFRYPRDTAKSYIKRVAAIAGDRVKIEGGVVFVNGHRIIEPYVPDAYEDVRSYPEIVVPAHCYFVLGDHRNLSNDSRDFGPVGENFIYGKAVFGYWPVTKLGKLR